MKAVVYLILILAFLLVTDVVGGQSTIYCYKTSVGTTIFSDSPCTDESPEAKTQGQLTIPDSQNILESRPILEQRSRTQGHTGKLTSEDTTSRPYQLVFSEPSFSDLLDGYIVAQDGTFLGKISTSTMDSQSILNSVGAHGSTVRRDSIFNSVGKFGSRSEHGSQYLDQQLSAAPVRINIPRYNLTIL